VVDYRVGRWSLGRIVVESPLILQLHVRALHWASLEREPLSEQVAFFRLLHTESMASTADYWVSGAIGSGAFGVVVHARHKTTGLDVAIKCLDKHSLAKYPHQALLVVQEQQLLKRLKRSSGPENNNNNSRTNDTENVGSNTTCPFVVNLYASFHDAMCVYLVTECCTGGTLQDFLEFQSTVSNGNNNGVAKAQLSQYNATSWYGWQLVQALWYLHTVANMVHCDVKPANILLTAAGCVKLADFGAAYDLNRVVAVAPTESTSTARSHFVQRGTAAYSAPELIHGSMDVLAPTAADVWSLGCVLYALLQRPAVAACVSSSPFDCRDEAATIQAIAAYCLQTNASARCAMLFGTTNASAETFAWTALIGGLLHPIATERLGARDALLQSSLPQQQQTEKVYPSIQASSAWQAWHLQEAPEAFWQRERATSSSQPLDPSIPLPPVPSWWTRATSLNTVYKDGQEGWSVFLV
jgi:serine/threonine protein kinase